MLYNFTKILLKAFIMVCCHEAFPSTFLNYTHLLLYPKRSNPEAFFFQDMWKEDKNNTDFLFSSHSI